MLFNNNQGQEDQKEKNVQEEELDFMNFFEDFEEEEQEEEEEQQQEEKNKEHKDNLTKEQKEKNALEAEKRRKREAEFKEFKEYKRQKQLEQAEKERKAREETEKAKQNEDKQKKAKERVEQEVADFNKEFPNVSIETLFNNKDFTEYADGKLGKKSLKEVYNSFVNYTSRVSNKEVEQIKKNFEKQSGDGSLPNGGKHTEQYSEKEVDEMVKKLGTLPPGKQRDELLEKLKNV